MTRIEELEYDIITATDAITYHENTLGYYLKDTIPYHNIKKIIRILIKTQYDLIAELDAIRKQ